MHAPGGELRIREEERDDTPHIREVNQRAFGGSDEANIVDALRLAGAITASLVAVEHDRVVGHILFTPVAIDTATVVGLGPMAVLPERQGKGIGSMLIQEGLAGLRHAGHDAVVLVGHPTYYPRFGFVPASRFGLRCVFVCPDEAFMAIELRPGSLAALRGVVHYRREFSEDTDSVVKVPLTGAGFNAVESASHSHGRVEILRPGYRPDERDRHDS